MTRILALDLALVSGLAYRGDGGCFRTATLTLGKPSAAPADNFVVLDRELTRLFECVPFDLVSVEDDTGRGAGARTLRGYHSVAMTAARRAGIAVRCDIGASKARRLALGDGGLSKEDAASAAWTLHGIDCDGPDETDACILLVATEVALAAEALKRAALAKVRKADAAVRRARTAAAKARATLENAA